MTTTSPGIAECDQPSSSLWWGACLVVCIALLLPLTIVDVPPLLDYPNHLARLFVLAHPDDPVLSQFYAPHWTITPNLAIDAVVPPLLRLLPMHVAGRIVIGATVLLPVIGCCAYHRALFGRRSLWPFGAGIVTYNALFFLGLLNFQITLGLALLAAGGWHIWSQRRPAMATLFGAVAAIILFFGHIFGLAFFAILVGAGELSALREVGLRRSELLRHLSRRGAMLASVFAVPVLLYTISPLSDIGGPPLWLEWHLKIQEILGPFLHYRRPVGILTMVAVTATTLALVGRKRLLAARGSPAALAILIALYVVMPSSAADAELVDARLPIMIGFLLFAGFRPSVPSRSEGAVVAAIFGAVFLIRIAATASVWQGQVADLAALRAAIAPVEPGSRVLVAVASAQSGEEWWMRAPENRVLPGWNRVDVHLSALLLIERRAFWPLLFTAPDKQPLSVRPPYARLAADPGWPPDIDALSAPVAATADSKAGYLANWRRDFDYLLVLQTNATNDPASLLPDRLDLVQANDMAALYRIRHAQD